MTKNLNDTINFIWTIAELLRDHYKPSKYSDVILPFTVLRRFDCVLTPTKDEVLSKHEEYKDKLDNLSPMLKKASGLDFYNTSLFNFNKLLDDPGTIKLNMLDYINGFSDNVLEIIDKFKLREQINYLDEKDLLYKIVQRFNEPKIDLHPDSLSNHDMGYVFEELIRRFNEQSNENPGDHFTPKEIIKLMVNILMSKDREELSKKGKVVKVYDPACGTGGMLTIAKEHILEDINSMADVELFGQEVNDETFAVCKSDMLIKGENANNIKYGSSFSRDGLKNETFDYILSNPPYGKDWNAEKEFIEDEYKKGSLGRFKAGLPRKSDGQLLFLQHMISKMHKDGDITRIAIVFNGSPLFTGDAGSGESEIRRWIIENDWLEAIVALPTRLFYNTGINTYIWILTNKKEKNKKDKITLINSVDLYENMPRNLGDKSHEISPEQIDEITNLYLNNIENCRVKLFDSDLFGYRRITVDRPLRMAFKINENRINKLKESKSFQNLAKKGKTENVQGKKIQTQILQLISNLPRNFYDDYNDFEKDLEKGVKKTDFKLSASIKKTIRNAIGSRDENSEIIKKSNGESEANTDFRDYEYVPLSDNVYEYFKKEVLPELPDAWINEGVVDVHDGKVGKVGYEINFNRYFYEYHPPRSLEDIDQDLEEVQGQILDLLGGLNK